MLIRYRVGRFHMFDAIEALATYQTINGPDARIFIQRYLLNPILLKWERAPVEITIEEFESCAAYERILMKLPH